MVVEERAASGGFGPRSSQHLVALGVESFTPFGVAQFDLVDVVDAASVGVGHVTSVAHRCSDAGVAYRGRMRARRFLRIGFFALVAALVAGVVAIEARGSRLRRRRDDVADADLAPPQDVTHLTVPTRDGGELHLVEAGSGRPVLLLHGVTLQWWVWSAVIRRLRTRYRVLAWDMRGHGRSVAGRDGVTMAAMATDVATVIEHLDLNDVIIVGHSLGGMVTGRFAVQHRDVLEARVGALLFLATSAASLAVKGIDGGLAALSAMLPIAGRAAVRNPSLAYGWPDTNLSAAMVSAAFGHRATARMIDDVRRMLAECPPRTLAEAGAAIAQHDVRAALGATAVPTTVVVGDEDRLTPPPHARTLAAIIAHSDLVELHGVGHQVMQEAPDELVEVIDRLAERSQP